MFEVRELNVAIELWGAAFSLVFIACALFFSESAKRYRWPIVSALAMVFAASVGDALAGIYRGGQDAFAWTMTHAGNLVSFAGGFLLVAFLTWYLSIRIYDSGGSDLRYWSLAVGVGAILMCVLAALGTFYYIDESNVYHRSDWHWVGQAFSIAVNLVNAVLILLNRRFLGKSTVVCLLFYTVLPIVASAVQSFVYGLTFQSIAIVLGMVVLFLEMQQYTSRILVERTEELARSHIEVSESRIAVMVSQIQPHFLFNTLDTIYGLVDEDKEKAKEAIASFSRFLRANLDSLKHAQPVPVEREMEHVRTYLELERMSDESRLGFELDTQATGFMVPALSVQTLVENAVKHGLGGRELGGRVIVRTREQQDEFTVEIMDDGVGFDINDVEQSEGVGIANTRARLSAMCGGTLDLASKPGEGTTAIMHIPKDAGRSGQ